MINIRNAKQYCCEDISLIENYDKAVNDKTQQWDCHHRAEVLPCGRFSRNDLKKHGLYWSVPASQLVFLTDSDHRALHSKNRSEKTRRKMSEVLKGKYVSDETKRRISEAKMGHEVSEETRKKISRLHKGRTLSEETRRKMSASRKGMTFSEETRRKISEAQKRRWERKRAAI